MSVPGQPDGQYTATGLEHSERARPRYDEATHSQMTEKRFRKLEAARLHAPSRCATATRRADRHRHLGLDDRQRDRGDRPASLDGLAVELIAPKMLRPLPDHQLCRSCRIGEVVLVPEVNYTGQFADMLTARYRGELQARQRLWRHRLQGARPRPEIVRPRAMPRIQPEAGPIRASR